MSNHTQPNEPPLKRSNPGRGQHPNIKGEYRPYPSPILSLPLDTPAHSFLDSLSRDTQQPRTSPQQHSGTTLRFEKNQCTDTDFSDGLNDRSYDAPASSLPPSTVCTRSSTRFLHFTTHLLNTLAMSRHYSEESEYVYSQLSFLCLLELFVVLFPWPGD